MAEKLLVHVGLPMKRSGEESPKPLVTGRHGRHLLLYGDSRRLRFAPSFDLVVTSPPFYHPVNRMPQHGCIPRTRDVEEYAEEVTGVLERTSRGLRDGGALCFVKTDVWYKSELIPVGWTLAQSMVRRGLPLRAHWVWEKRSGFSPYGPGFANVFLFCRRTLQQCRFNGVIKDQPCPRGRSLPSTHAPGLFAWLVQRLSPPEGLVLDPFVGTGSVVAAAARTGRWSVGIDLSSRQLALARRLLGSRDDVVFSEL